MAGRSTGVAIRLCSAAIALGALVAGAEASTIWQTDWTMTQPMGSPSGSTALATLHDSGEMSFAYFTYPGASVVRLHPDSSLRWQYTAAPTVRDMKLLPSGATVITYARDSDHVALLSENGELLWDSRVVASYIAVSGGNIYTVGCRNDSPVVSALDAADGSVHWQQVIGTARCLQPGDTTAIAADSDGGVVATFARGLLTGTRTLTKLAPDGSIGWTQELPFQQETVSTFAKLFRHGDAFYLEADPQLAAFRSSDGQPLWQHRCGLSVAFSGADPGCLEGTRNLVRLSAADGGVVWRRQLPSGLIQAGDGSDLYGVDRNTGTWLRVSGSTGEIVWSKPFPVRFSGLWVNVALGQAKALVGTDDGQLSIDTYRLDDGTLQHTTASPLFDRTLNGTLLRVDGSDLFIGGATASSSWKLRRLSADTGSVIWENQRPLSTLASFGITPNSVVVAERVPLDQQVRSIARDSGSDRWSKSLPIIPSSEQMWLFGTPQDDVLVASYAYTPDDYRARLWRLSGNDGTELWSRHVRPDIAPQIRSEHIVVAVGNDLVSVDKVPFLSQIQRIDAVTGQTLWTRDNYPDYPPARAAATPGNDAVYFVEEFSEPPRLMRRSAVDGSSAWSLPLTMPAARARVADVVALDGGDALVAANTYINDGSPSWRVNGPPQLLRLRADGSGVRYHWQGSVPSTGLNDQVGPVRIDSAAATAWMPRTLSLGDFFSIAVLERFDLATDQHLGAQFYRVYGAPLHFPHTAWDNDFTVYQGHILSGGGVVTGPTTTARRHALRNFHIDARGDLALTIAPLAPGATGSLQTLDVRVAYDGDAPTTATLFVDAPWPLHGAPAVCSGNGISDCSVDTRMSPWAVRFTAAPGAQLQLGATLRVLAAPAPAHAQIRALVFGHENLLETSASNNIAATAPLDVLFVDSFEQVLPRH